MDPQTPPVLSDPQRFPDDDVLADVLGPAKAAYDALLLRLAAVAPGAAVTWKYYRDGGSWLLSAAWRKKTLFWLRADRGAFRVTFYLPAALEPALLASDLPESVKQGYSASAGKKIRGTTVIIGAPVDLAAFDTLLALKRAAR